MSFNVEYCVKNSEERKVERFTINRVKKGSMLKKSCSVSKLFMLQNDM